MEMEKTVKMCDMPGHIARRVLQMLNKEHVTIKDQHPGMGMWELYSDVDPRDLIYPEGWYYQQGMFRNKHTNSTGCYEEFAIFKSSGEIWE